MSRVPNIQITMNIDYKQYHLEKYHGPSSRYTCPKCGRVRAFTRYVDDDGRCIDETVGRCDHESSCGYHYTPKQYFLDNPDNQERPWNARPRWTTGSRPAPQPQKPDYIDPVYVVKSKSLNSTLADYLLYLFDEDAIKRVWAEYFIGATKDMGVVFWQVDAAGKARTAKIIHYHTNGHRDKERGANWVHAILKRKKAVPESFHLVQCLFGEHLLAKHPDKTVALVEAEKTAVVCAMQFPDFVWVATGGKSQMSGDKMGVLRGRNVVAFPDADGLAAWTDKAKELAKIGVCLNVQDYIERNATPEQKAMGADIADLILMEREAQGRRKLMLENIAESNPDLRAFIDTLQLEIVSCSR